MADECSEPETTMRSRRQRAAVVKLRGSGWRDGGTPERLLGCVGKMIAQGRRGALNAALNSMVSVAH
jgi:hypothetical protein